MTPVRLLDSKPLLGNRVTIQPWSARVSTGGYNSQKTGVDNGKLPRYTSAHDLSRHHLVLVF